MFSTNLHGASTIFLFREQMVDAPHEDVATKCGLIKNQIGLGDVDVILKVCFFGRNSIYYA